MAACPYIDKSFTPNPQFNTPIEYEGCGGTPYTYYRHDDGFGGLSLVQFCERIGRKRDVFQCLNEREWKCCSYFRMEKTTE